MNAVVLVNLGTPRSPSVRDVRRFLGEMLADPCLVGLPRFLWLPLLHGVILKTRPRKSAEKYASIWTADGSPLQYHMERVRQRLQTALEGGGAAVRVETAMRYGDPSIPFVLDRLASAGYSNILLFPLYPHALPATSGTALSAAMDWAKRAKRPDCRIRLPDRPGYGSDLGYIASLADAVRAYGRDDDCLLMSFHGLPRADSPESRAYRAACLETARRLADALELKSGQWRIGFQSRFGFGKWLEPDTARLLAALPKEGLRRIGVVCPSFAVDCLETLYDIEIVGQRIFRQAGGRQFNFIPCLNDRASWIGALSRMVREPLFS